MKRGLKVKTGLHVPAYISAEGIKARRAKPNPDGTWPIPADAQLDPIRCTMTPPCGHCYYCKLRELPLP